MSFYLGCAVWSYGRWVGALYPPKTPSKDFLKLYSQRLTTVEGNTTFYAVPSEETIQRWRNQTSSYFRFCLKFPKIISHRGLLLPQLPEAIAFLERVKGLNSRLGAVFAQLPPKYSPDYWDDLRFFLESVANSSICLALEVRHLDWFSEPYQSQLNEFLTALNIACVLLDTRPIYNCPDDPQITSERRKPNVPLIYKTTANFTLIRFISHPQQQWNEKYLQEWVNSINQWINQGVTVYFFVHCPIEDYSPLTARYFQQILEKQKVNIPPLPWNQLPNNPQQLSLF